MSRFDPPLEQPVATAFGDFDGDERLGMLRKHELVRTRVPSLRTCVPSLRTHAQPASTHAGALQRARVFTWPPAATRAHMASTVGCR
jgi:hypothetical protein